METIQQSSILCRFPTEILENIALEVVSVTPLGPPKELIPLLCTCRKVCLTLQSSHFYARIFKIKFDHGAVRRRFGPKSIRSTNMALQLRKYCNNLQDLRRGDIYSSHIHDILRTAFFMATENDGRNACQLEWAGLDKFVDRFVRARLCEDVAQNNGWPAESSINALALWLMWFTTTWGQYAWKLLSVYYLIVAASLDKLKAESMKERQEIIDLILPYVILPFRVRDAQTEQSMLTTDIRTVPVGLRTAKPLRSAAVRSVRTPLSSLRHNCARAIPTVPRDAPAYRRRQAFWSSPRIFTAARHYCRKVIVLYSSRDGTHWHPYPLTYRPRSCHIARPHPRPAYTG